MTVKPEMTAEEKEASKKRKQELRDMLAARFTAHYLEVPEKFEKDINVVMQKSGLFEVRFNEIGVFIKKTDHAKGAQDKLREGFNNLLPRKIPLSVLQYTIDLFKVVNEVHSAEFYLQYYWDRETKKYIVHYPLQKTNGAHVDYEREEALERRYLLVMDIHSHNTMGAFFSGTDDADEKETRMFGVIGKITKDIPEMKFRVCCGGKHLAVEPWDIFDFKKVSDNNKELSEAMLKGDHRPIEYTSNWNGGYWQGHGATTWKGASTAVTKPYAIEDDEWQGEFDYPGQTTVTGSSDLDDDASINVSTEEEDEAINIDDPTTIEEAGVKPLFDELWRLEDAQLYVLMKEFVECGWYQQLRGMIDSAHEEVWGEVGIGDPDFNEAEMENN